MKLSDKYGIPESAVKAMIKDGWISCSAPQYEEIIIFYKEEKSKGIGTKQAVYNTSVKARLSERQIYNIIHKFD